MPSNKSKVYAFIDSQNLNLAIKDQGWELDFERFFIYLQDKYAVSRAFIFIGYVPGMRQFILSYKKLGL